VASAYTDALRLLAGRELTAAECRARLIDRGHTAGDAEAAVQQLLEERALDDHRVARAYARTALEIKGRGRLRIAQALAEKGVSREVIAAALAEVFGDVDERALVARAIQKKLRGRPRPASAPEFARLYQHLMRQGFSPAVVSAEIRRLRGQKSGE
jgi:regulatory protein